jgi:hypothetical protein
LINALQAQSTYINGEADANNSTFPFVSLKSFEINGQSIRTQSKIEMSLFCPIVQSNQKDEWKRFSKEAKSWINLSREQAARSPEQAKIPSLSTSAFSTINISEGIVSRNFISGETEETRGDGPFLPWWYQTPPPNNLANINTDMLTHPTIRRLFGSLLETKLPAFSSFLSVLPFVDNSDYHVDFHRQTFVFSPYDIHSQKWGIDDQGKRDIRELSQIPEAEVFHAEDAMAHPHSILLYPVFRDLYNENSPIVGVIVAVIAWDAYLTNLLPPGHTGVQIVLKNTCGDSVTYSLYSQTVSSPP